MHALEKIKKEEVWQDEWIHSMCKMCLHECGILVHVVNGVAIKIDPDPDNPDNLGVLCPKSQYGIFREYDPYRVTKPLLRTNPEKGIGVDPKWKEISWDEAFDILVEKLKSVRRTDPRNLLAGIGDFQRGPPLWTGWAAAVWPAGTEYENKFLSFFNAQGIWCGAGYHPAVGAVSGGFAGQPDWQYCSYLIVMGGGDGFTSHLHLSGSAKRCADARMRGMKLVCIDPRFSEAAAKADEWIPIRNKTDGALLHSMMYVMIHELKRYDALYFKKQTNAPYLIGPDGGYVRDKATKKPLVWDAAANEAKPYDAVRAEDYALEGVYEVDGLKCRPGFQIFADQSKNYTPEKAAEITGVPTDTIRRISKEFVEAAQIGKTIALDGVEYPYRPAVLNWYSGGHADRHSYQNNLTNLVFNLFVGNLNAVGGYHVVPLGWNPLVDEFCHIEPGEDGLVKPQYYDLRGPIPAKWPPDNWHLIEFFPIGLIAGGLSTDVLLNPDKYGTKFKPENMVGLFHHCNPVWHMPGSLMVAEVLKRVNFICVMDVMRVGETVDLADLLLPDKTYLESYVWPTIIEHPFVTGRVFRQPAVKPPPEAMDAMDFFTELSDRLGLLPAWNNFLTFVLRIYRRPDLVLEPNKKYGIEELVDRSARAQFGDEYGLEWFKKNGCKMRLKTPKEMYNLHGDLKIPFYNTDIRRVGEGLRVFIDGIKDKPEWMNKFDLTEYQPLPFWKPSTFHQKDPTYDLLAMSYKSAIFYFCDTQNVYWVKEVVEKARPDLAWVQMNSRTAEEKGLKEGDRVRVTSIHGSSVEGRIHVTEGMFPETVAISIAGRWIKHPGAMPQSPVFNVLLSPAIEYVDPVSGGYETVVRVKVEKLE